MVKDAYNSWGQTAAQNDVALTEPTDSKWVGSGGGEKGSSMGAASWWGQGGCKRARNNHGNHHFHAANGQQVGGVGCDVGERGNVYGGSKWVGLGVMSGSEEISTGAASE